MELIAVKIEIPEGCNMVLGHTHFIKSVEDLYEIMITNVPGAKFGVAFNEASGPCLIRADGNDEGLKLAAVTAVRDVAAGHLFCIMMKECFPINVLNAVKACPEVVNIFCATANPVEVIVAQTTQGRGVMGVVDGFSPKGVETAEDVKERKAFLRKIGYKL